LIDWRSRKGKDSSSMLSFWNSISAAEKVPPVALAECVAIIKVIEERWELLLGPRLIPRLIQHANEVYEFRGDFVRVLYKSNNEITPIILDALYLSTPPEETKIIVASEQDWSRLIKYLAQNPNMIYSLTPRKFEELVAELFIRDGMRVQLTPSTNDGGRDILVVSDTSLGKHLYYVECKQYSKDNPVGVELIRALYGVVEADKATAGLLVTTSYFTKGAKSFHESLKHRLSLRDHDDLIEWLKMIQ